MRYTAQAIVAGYALPEGNDVDHFSSLKDLKEWLKDTHREAERCGAGYEPSTALVWKGTLKDVTDMPWDFDLRITKRGGVVKGY